MAKIVKPLTETQIKNAKSKEKTYTLGDGGGLYLEVNVKGGKWWRFRYYYETKAKKISFGTYPTTTLKQARFKRDEAKSILANENRDPFAKVVVHEDTEVVQKTFKEWAKWYIDEISTELSDSHIARTIKSFKKDVYPEIGHILMNDIKTKDIIEIMRTMKERGAIESARKTFSSINRVFSKTISNFPDEIERNPTADISLSDVIGKKKTVSYPVITESKALGTLLNIISEYGVRNEADTDDKTRAHSSTRLALMMLPHVFTRPTNLRLARWEDINLKTKQWIIPADKMKTKKELIVPLSKQVILILKEAKEQSPDSDLVFPSNRGKHTPMSDNALVGALRRMDYTRDEIVAHSFRGIFSTIAHEQAKYQHDVIETQLAHTVGSQVSQAYNRAKHLEERTEMMQWWSNHLTQIQKEVEGASK